MCLLFRQAQNERVRNCPTLLGIKENCSFKVQWFIEALDEITPLKSFTIRSHHRFGVSEVTKELIKQRDKCRLNLKKCPPSEKIIMFEKYKKLRNKVNCQIRKDNVYFNNEKIKKANDENELWKIAKEIAIPRNVNSWEIQHDTLIRASYNSL